MLIDRDAERLERARADLATRGAELRSSQRMLAVPDDLQSRRGVASRVALAKSAVAHPGARRSPAKVPGRNRRAWANWITTTGRKSLDVNLTSVVFTIQAFLPFMKRAGGGRIVLVSSTAGLSASPTAALSYSVAKAAIAALAPSSRARARSVQGADQCRRARQVLQSRLARRA